jgi:hypothetical protein
MRFMNTTTGLAGFAALAVLVAGDAAALDLEDDQGFLPRSARVSVGFDYRTWSIDQEIGEDFRLSQLVVPTFVHTALRRDVELSYLFNIADSRLDADSADEAALGGITDGKLALTYFFPDRRFSAGLGLRVPTGKSRLDPDEEVVAQQLAERIFGFRVKRYGEGTDVEVRGGAATLFDGGVSLAAGVSYLVKGDFAVVSPIDREESTYEPGNELSLLGGVGARFADRDWNGRVQFTTFAADERDGAKEIEEGAEASLRLRVRDEHLIGVIDWEGDALWKGETKVVSAGGQPPTRDVGGSILRLGGTLMSRWNQKTSIGGGGALSWYGETDRGVGDGLIFEAGPRIRRSIQDNLDLEGGYTLYLGNAEDGTVGLTGHDLTLAVVFRHDDPFGGLDGEEIP